MNFFYNIFFLQLDYISINECFELWVLLLFCRSIFQSQNGHKDLPESENTEIRNKQVKLHDMNSSYVQSIYGNCKKTFDALQETLERHTPKDKFENSVTAAKCIPIKKEPNEKFPGSQ